jgi:four helix bundle protein
LSTFNNFEEIEAWQKARELTREIYRIIYQDLFSKDFGLRDQIQRASVSVMANIAEGFERGGTKEFAQFLSIAKGSAGEVRSLLYVALDQAYISREVFNRLLAIASETARMIGGLMNYLRTTKIRGTKFKRT